MAGSKSIRRIHSSLIAAGKIVFAVMWLAACSGGGGGDGGGGGETGKPVSNGDNPPIASLSEILDFPSTKKTTFQALNTAASADNFDGGHRSLSITDTGAPIEVSGGFKGFSFFGASFEPYDFGGFAEEDGAIFRMDNVASGSLYVLKPGQHASGLKYASFAVWADSLSSFWTGLTYIDQKSFAFGLASADWQVPLTGTAAFHGYMAATHIWSYPGLRFMTGSADLNVNFGAQSLTGVLNATDVSFPQINLSGSYSGNRISGSAWTGGMNGSFVGRFFGPGAEEIGGTFGITDSDEVVSGAFAATRISPTIMPDTSKLSELTTTDDFVGPAATSGFDSVGIGTVTANPARHYYVPSWDRYATYTEYDDGDPATLSFYASDYSIYHKHLAVLTPGASGFDYTSYGVWSERELDFSTNPAGTKSFWSRAISFGYATRDMPASGSASYAGRMDGWYSDGPATTAWVKGDAALSVNFGEGGPVTGSFTNLKSASDPSVGFADISVNASISGNQFAGTATSGSSAMYPGALGADMSGPLKGKFYGPAAVEAGGTFRMGSADNREFVGAFAAKQ